jgi:hypothetical protein
MHLRLIFTFISLVVFSCTRLSTNLIYFQDTVYKHLFTYDGSSYCHVVFVKNYKTGVAPNQKELEQLALHYALEYCKRDTVNKIDYIMFIHEEFAQKDEIDEFRLANVHLLYENDKINIKSFYQEQ